MYFILISTSPLKINKCKARIKTLEREFTTCNRNAYKIQIQKKRYYEVKEVIRQKPVNLHKG